jgi:pimeloyl-ACP methyl ester carboxylesterase
MGPWLNSAFRPARERRDIVLFDIRGTGKSGILDCPYDLSTSNFSPEGIRKATRDCVTKYGPVGPHCSSREIVEDIERFRLAMGYGQISLWGGSFGTRLAQHYVRAYGAHLKAVVLDAATPVTETILTGAPITGERALQILFSSCAADPACHTAFPALKDEFGVLLRRVTEAPVHVQAVDPRRGEMVDTVIDKDGVSGLVRGALYAGYTHAVLPYAISTAAKEDYKALLALGAATTEWSVDTMAYGSLLSIICAEDQERARKGNPAARSFGFMGDSYWRYFDVACSAWPHRALPDNMFGAISSAVPAMVISGEFDPVTPPSSGEATLKQFKTGVHVIVPQGFHTNSSSSCVADLIGDFLSDPATGARKQDCLKRSARVRFLTTPNH